MTNRLRMTRCFMTRDAKIYVFVFVLFSMISNFFIPIWDRPFDFAGGKGGGGEECVKTHA